MHQANVRRLMGGSAALVVLLGACTDGTSPPLPPPPDDPSSYIIELVDPAPGDAPVGTEITPGLSFRVVNAATGTAAAGQRVTFTASGGGTLEAGVDTSDAGGLVSPGTWVLGTRSGIQRLVASPPGGTPTVVQVTALAEGISSLLPPTGVPGSNLLAGSAITPTFVAVDSFGNRAGGGTDVTFTALEGTIDETDGTTDASGNVSPGSWVLSDIIGPQRLVAEYEVDGDPRADTVTVEAVCDQSRSLASGGSVLGQWRAGNCRTATQRIEEYSFSTGAQSSFSLTLSNIVGQSVRLRSAEDIQTLPPPAYLYAPTSNPYTISYIVPSGNFVASAYAPDLNDNLFTLARSGSLGTAGSVTTGPNVGCAQAGRPLFYTTYGANIFNRHVASNTCNFGGLGAFQDRYLVQVAAGDTLNVLVVQQGTDSTVRRLQVNIRDANTAGGAVVATGARPTPAAAANVRQWVINNGNGFIAPATGLYEVIIGTTVIPPVTIAGTAPNGGTYTGYNLQIFR